MSPYIDDLVQEGGFKVVQLILFNDAVELHIKEPVDADSDVYISFIHLSRFYTNGTSEDMDRRDIGYISVPKATYLDFGQENFFPYIKKEYLALYEAYTEAQEDKARELLSRLL